MYSYPVLELTSEQMKSLLDELEKCIDDPFVALHKGEAQEILGNYGIGAKATP